MNKYVYHRMCIQSDMPVHLRTATSKVHQRVRIIRDLFTHCGLRRHHKEPVHMLMRVCKKEQPKILRRK